ncbi:MAG TPA: hypothetical protein VGZ01_10970 [Trinickia sp.]|nr:hypothetical protein [Trinickia sp.]
MDIIPLALHAGAAVGLGSAATFLLTQLIPEPVAELAAHGRFAGIGEADFPPTPGQRRRRHAQFEVLNVVGTAS